MPCARRNPARRQAALLRRAALGLMLTLASLVGNVALAAPAPAPAPAAAPAAGELVDGELPSELVPSPVRYYALLPPAALRASASPLPLLLFLHGGGGSRDALLRVRGMVEAAWQDGRLPPFVLVTPSVTERGFYLDRRDGSERWETFIRGPFLAHLRARLPVRGDAAATFLAGVSMGGMGALRIALKHPTEFGGAAGLAPGIEPVLAWADVRPKHRFWRSDALLQAAYGTPVDPAYYAANNPASIVVAQADAIRASGLKLFVEAGDADMFWLYEGAEFLHQQLWQQRIRHEYRLYHGADHLGPSLGPRTEAAFAFLLGTLRPPAMDAATRLARQRIDPLKRGLDEADHYGVDAHLIERRD